MKRSVISFILIAACAACGSQQTAENQVHEVAAINAEVGAEVSPEQIRPVEPGELPDDRNLVEEGPIDPKSGQGAGQVLQSYAALLEQGRLAEARRLWTAAGAGSGLSEDIFAKYSEIHAEIGSPGAVEGAAGSAYVEIPLRFYGKLKGGRSFNSIGTATLRRVNDVPGSTEEQRRWHIYRIDVQPPL